MFGDFPFAVYGVGDSPIVLGAIGCNVLTFPTLRCQFNIVASILAQIRLDPAKMANFFEGNDTDFYVENVTRSRDTSPINDMSLFGTIALSPEKPVTGATNATPIVITSTAHGLVTGQQVFILEVNGNLAANGAHTVTKLTDDTFSLDGSVGTGAFTDPGRWWLGVPSAVKIPLTYISGSNGSYVGTIPGTAPIELGKSYYRFVECSNYNFAAGPTPVDVQTRK